MNKKGLTLVELLAVIIVLAIVSGLAVYSVSNIISTGKKGVYKNFENTLENATKEYLVDNIDLVPETNDSVTVTYNELLSKNYIEEFKDPNGNNLESSYVEVFRNNDINSNKVSNYNLAYNVCLIGSDNNNNISYKTHDECVIYTKNDCFTINNIDNKSVTISGYNSDCTDSVNIPSKINGYRVTKIDDSAFKGKGLKNIIIPNTITEIGSRAFEENSLENVIIPNSVTKLGSYAFYRNKLKNVVLSNKLSKIPSYSFGRNYNLNNIVIPDNITEIGDRAFIQCGLTNITLSSNIERIGIEAFKKLIVNASGFAQAETSNPNLKTISINKSCDEIQHMNYYPWLHTSPYYIQGKDNGVTIYGKNNIICDKF